MVLIITTILISGFVVTNALCPAAAFAQMPFILEYALWRGWNQAVLFSPSIEQGESLTLSKNVNMKTSIELDNTSYDIEKFLIFRDCQWTIVRLVKCLSVNSVAVAKDSMINPRLVTKLGIVVLTPDLRQNSTRYLYTSINKLQELQMNTASFDWLITARSEKDFKIINGILNTTFIRFDQNLIVTYTRRYDNTVSGVCDTNFTYKRKHHPRGYNCKIRNCCKNCQEKSEYERSYFRTTERFKNLSKDKFYEAGRMRPLFQSGNIFNMSRKFEIENVTNIISLNSQYIKWNQNTITNQKGQIYVLQYFKARINSTLYTHFLGIWSQKLSMAKVTVPYPVEARNLQGEEFIIGKCNSSWSDTPSPDNDGPSAPVLLDDVLCFLTARLNISPTIKYYSKLGFRSYDGTWSGLLGALMDHSIDMALEPVTAHTSHHEEMELGFPITETMCNIYIRHQETSTVRDIFLAPFSARLVACVFSVAFIASLAIVLISRLPRVQMSTRNMGYTEALIWSMGILCQQGASWTPPNLAGNFVLIICLFFALVTYNAYAAFITSVLSVRVASVSDVAAVLQSPNIKIGYIRNGVDQMYLMSTKDTQLNAFYIRGYSNAENLVSSAEEGLERAASLDYAFFAGLRVARTTLRSFSQARGRCAIRELQVPSSKAYLGFPLAQHSPYARPILLSILQLRSGGAIVRLKAALVPDMPQCSTPTGFASARATDVQSAFILFAVGFIVAFLLGVGEYFWKNRGVQKIVFKEYYARMINIIRK